MGLYLQFNQGQDIEAIVQQQSVGQLRNALEHLPGWSMDTREEDGFVKAVFYKEKDSGDNAN